MFYVKRVHFFKNVNKIWMLSIYHLHVLKECKAEDQVLRVDYEVHIHSSSSNFGFIPWIIDSSRLIEKIKFKISQNLSWVQCL